MKQASVDVGLAAAEDANYETNLREIKSPRNARAPDDRVKEANVKSGERRKDQSQDDTSEIEDLNEEDMKESEGLDY